MLSADIYLFPYSVRNPRVFTVDWWWYFLVRSHNFTPIYDFPHYFPRNNTHLFSHTLFEFVHEIIANIRIDLASLVSNIAHEILSHKMSLSFSSIEFSKNNDAISSRHEVQYFARWIATNIFTFDTVDCSILHRYFNFRASLFASRTHVLRTTLRISTNYHFGIVRLASDHLGNAPRVHFTRRQIFNMSSLFFDVEFSKNNAVVCSESWIERLPDGKGQIFFCFKSSMAQFSIDISIFARLFSVAHILWISPRFSTSFGSLRPASARVSCYKVPRKYFSCFRESNFQIITPR